MFEAITADIFYSPKICHSMGHFTVVYLVAKPLIWSEAEGDLTVIDE